jgi:Flp pilus assembly pilin Flp
MNNCIQHKRLKQSGQSLVEYLIIVAIMGVATLGVVRILGNTVSGKFAQVVQSLQGKKTEDIKFEDVEKKHFERKDMSDFMNGSRKGL